MRVLAGSSVCAKDFQPVQGHGFGGEGFELDLCDFAGVAFTPAIDAGLGFLAEVAGGGVEEVAGVVERSILAGGVTCERFDYVAAQKFWPVDFKELRGSERVAP